MSNWAKSKEYEKIEGTFDKLHKYYSPKNTKKKENERKFWLIFFMIESLAMEENYNIRKACDVVGKEIAEHGRSLRTRYYELQKKVADQKLLVEDIKNRYGWTNKNFRDLVREYK